MSSEFGAKFKLRDLLINYLRRCHLPFEWENDEDFVIYDDVIMHSMLRVGWGTCCLEVGSSLIRRSNKTRTDYLIAAQYAGTDDSKDIYYGRVLTFLEFTCDLKGNSETHRVMLVDWVQGLEKSRFGEVYSRKSGKALFGKTTVEDVRIILHGIGFVERTIPGTRVKATYFIDSLRRLHSLLHRERVSPDGVDRILHGLA